MTRINNTLICFGADRLVEVFADFGVEFVLIGGQAVSWHCSSRSADDTDLLVNHTQDNSVKIAKAFGQLNLKNYTNDSFAKLGVYAPVKTDEFYVDILTLPSDALNFEEIMSGSIEGLLGYIPVRIASIGDLIKLNELATLRGSDKSEKHRCDIKLLREIQGGI